MSIWQQTNALTPVARIHPRMQFVGVILLTAANDVTAVLVLSRSHCVGMLRHDAARLDNRGQRLPLAESATA